MMLKSLRKFLKNYNISLSDSSLSLVLGVIMVLGIGLLSYNYFRTNRQVVNVTPAEVTDTGEGDLTIPGAAVALPANHTVTAGENLWVIAEKYYASGYNYVDITAANDLSNPNHLLIGQKLVIPKVEVRKPRLETGAVVYPQIKDSKIDGSQYVVTRGDNLWTIALRAYGDGFKWVQIAKTNNLTNPNIIHSGLRLQIPR